MINFLDGVRGTSKCLLLLSRETEFIHILTTTSSDQHSNHAFRHVQSGIRSKIAAQVATIRLAIVSLANTPKLQKSVCPDAYSYAFDDQTSTFIIPSGAGFQVIFCPGGRSTNILAIESDELHQLAETGQVTSSGDTQGLVVTKGAAARNLGADKTTRWLMLGMLFCTTFLFSSL